jgi:hypothetical protein
MEVGGQSYAPTALRQGKRLGTYSTGVCTENIAPPPGFDPRAIQLVAESLYRLRYPGPHAMRYYKYNIMNIR